MSTCTCNCNICVARRAVEDAAKAQGRIYAVRRFLDEAKFLDFADNDEIIAAVSAEQAARAKE